jgi:hypothetical protein
MEYQEVILPGKFMKIKVRRGTEADSILLYFSDEAAAYSRNLDANRIVEYSEKGEIVCIRFLSSSSGLRIDDLPYRTAIESALNDKPGIKTDNPRHSEFKFADKHSNEEVSHSSGITSKPQVKMRIKAVCLVSAVTVLSLAFIAADILLARNLIVLTSFPLIVISVFGLVAALFPTILGCLVLAAWVLYRLGKAGHFDIKNYLNSDIYSGPRRR